MKPIYILVHLYDTGSSHPEVANHVFTSEEEVLAEVKDITGLTFSSLDEIDELVDLGDGKWLSADDCDDYTEGYLRWELHHLP